MIYNSKVITSGRFIEIYEYSDYQFKDEKKTEKVITALELMDKVADVESYVYPKNDDYLKSYKRLIDEVTGEVTFIEVDRTKEVVKRSMINVNRLINSNLGQNKRVTEKFYTFTFKENMQDRQKAISEFNKFIYKLRRKKKKKIDYIATIELQKRGAIHFHVLFFNLPFTDKEEIETMWGNGFIKIESIKNQDVANYIIKYITKDMATGRKQGERRYLHSRGLKKPLIEQLDDVNVDDYIDNETVIVTQTNFSNEFTGAIRYTRLYKKGELN